MTSFSESALEQKLAELNNSQQSIQTLSLWVIHHRKHCKAIVNVWYKDLLKAKPSRKLTYMYLANDVIQNSKKKGPEYSKEFGNVLVKAFQYVGKNADEKTHQGLFRLLNVWKERFLYSPAMLETFFNAIKKRNSVPDAAGTPTNEQSNDSRKEHTTASKKQKKHHHRHVHEPNVAQVVAPSPPRPSAAEEESIAEVVAESQEETTPGKGPPDPDTVIKAILDLENAASGDAAVREKIASFPPEVSDISLLEKIKDKEAGEKLIKQVNEACELLVDYNGRLVTELEERRDVAKMLTDFISTQKELLSQDVHKMEPQSHQTRMIIHEALNEEYQQKLQKVNQVRSELKSHIQNLPDLTLLPDVTGGLAPLPSAGDLFSLVN